MTEQQPSGDFFGRFVGLLLMGIAVLWMAFFGLCAFGMLASVFTEGSEMAVLALFVLVIAGAAAAGGYAVFIAGRSLWRG